jgi:thymidine kinase
MTGYLDITFGPMFSGKTNNLIDKVNSYIDKSKQQGKNNKTLVINHSSDDRDVGLSPHTKREVKTLVFKASLLSEINVDLYNYIAIDEAQFFPDLKYTVEHWLKLGKRIHCVGLIANTERQVFGQLSSLFVIADNITQLKAFCYVCGDKTPNASFTISIVPKKDGILVGAQEYYRPVCGNHYKT